LSLCNQPLCSPPPICWLLLGRLRPASWPLLSGGRRWQRTAGELLHRLSKAQARLQPAQKLDCIAPLRVALPTKEPISSSVKTILAAAFRASALKLFLSRAWPQLSVSLGERAQIHALGSLYHLIRYLCSSGAHLSFSPLCDTLTDCDTTFRLFY
jgi:hypothetical protein